MFGHNGNWVTAFTDVDVGEGLVPAVSGKHDLNVKVNFGQDAFRYGMLHSLFMLLQREVCFTDSSCVCADIHRSA